MKERSSKGWKACLAVTCIVVVIVLVIVILALTMFKPKHPISTVDSIKIQDMDMSYNIFRMGVNLNVTLDVDVSVKNTNKFGFMYSNGTAQLNYRGQQIGEAPIPNGELSAGETKGINLTLTIVADRFLSNYQVSPDVNSGILPLNTLVRVFGEVNILGFLKFHVHSSSSCDFILHLSDRTVGDKVCQYKTKI